MLIRLVLGLLFLAALPVRGEPLSIDDAVAPEGMLSASLSPDGRHIAAVIYNGTNYGLILLDTATFTPKTLAQGRKSHVGLWNYLKAPRRVAWAGNDTLVVDYGLEAESMDLDGKKLRSLGERIVGPAEYGRVDSTRVLVLTDVDDSEIALCDARAGKCSAFSYPKGKPIKWAFDRRGMLRAVSMLNSAFWKDVSTVTNWYRAADSDEWVKLAEFKITDDYWQPVYVPDEPDTLVINSRQGRDTYALFAYDTKRRVQGEMLAGHPTEDIVSVKGIDQAASNYVSTDGMIPAQVWFDPTWSGMQKLIDTVLSGKQNILTGNPSEAMLVLSYADIDPGTWYFFDVPKRQLTEIGRIHPAVKAEQMRRMEIISYRTEDKLVVPAYLTRPAQADRPLPMVVLIHGGPKARDKWEWNAEVQLLASHGYVVFQPQFRGSSGFGRRFEEAGYGQWGRAMQDDITAGVNELIKRGIADRKRICIVGSSYGGYAALWGLVKTPELYRCGVSFAGVVDIAYMFSDFSDSALNKVSREVMLTRVGDKKMSNQLFDPVSPLRHAGEIKAPVLLMHGTDDDRVPISHSRKMRDALEEKKKAVRLIEFEDEKHGLSYTKNQYTYFKELLNFLDEHIGAGGTRTGQ